MKTLLNLTALAGLTVLACLTCVIAPPAQAKDYDIWITADGFSPAYLEVTVGDTVYWWNVDYDFFDYHSTHSYSYPWNSGRIEVDYGVALLTTQTGTYDYVDDWGYSGWGTLVIKPAGPPPPPPATTIPAPDRVDMVYDAGRDILYITSGSSVLRYQVSSATFLTPFQLSGSLMGIDLSPDGNTLVVADATATSSNIWVHVIDLMSEQSHQVFFPASFYEAGTFAVAFGEDGAALITSRFGGSGWVPLRRYDPASGLTTTITDSIRQDSMVSSSGDGSTIVIAQSNSSGGEFNLYDVARKTIIKNGGTGRFNYECAANRDASLFALPTYFGTFIYDANLNQVTNIGVYAGEQPIGAVFHPAADAVFFAFAGTSYVRAYSTTTWELLGEWDVQTAFSTPGNHAFTNGRIRISPDGQTIFVTVNGGVSYVRHGLNLPLTHRLVVAGNPGPYGEPTPMSYGTYWLPDGTYVGLNVPQSVETNGTTFICTGWTGTGSAAAASGSTTDIGFSLMANSTVTWNWKPFVVSAHVEAAPSGGQIVLQWPSIAWKSYDLLWATNLNAGFTPVATDLPATPPNNVYQGALGPAGAGFFKVLMK